MRFLPIATLALAVGFLAAVHPWAAGPGAGWPNLALFTFAVSAFREPLR